MEGMREKWKGLMRERWVVFVCSMWVQSFAGMAYMFGAISPAIKATMGYNQKQLAVLAVAKDLGDNIGFVAGRLSQVSSISKVLIVGALQNFAGYLLLWLVITHEIPLLPLWALCICIFVGNNAATYYNTATLVSCVKNFPQNRGPVVGILKGFVGLSGAIMTQIVAIFFGTPDQASLIFIIAVGPSMVSLSLSFIIRPIHGNHQQAKKPSHGSSFLFIYCVCLILASYLMGVLMLQDKMDLKQSTIKLLGIILTILILLPIIVPVYLVFFSKHSTQNEEESLLVDPAMAGYENETCVDEETEENRGNSVAEGPRQIVQLQAKIFQALAETMNKLKQKDGNGPQIGEDFTLIQALMTPEFWLVFFALVMGSGTGLTIINNMGQICQSLGDNNATVYVSMISIFNFLGPVGGGYFSEVINESIKEALKKKKKNPIPKEFEGPVGKNLLIKMKNNDYNKNHPGLCLNVNEFAFCEDLLPLFDSTSSNVPQDSTQNKCNIAAAQSGRNASPETPPTQSLDDDEQPIIQIEKAKKKMYSKRVLSDDEPIIASHSSSNAPPTARLLEAIKIEK